MQQHQQGNNQGTGEDKKANSTHGPQGIDKAPGEEPSEDNIQFTKETQKGKKVDADPEQASDKPADQNL